MLEARGIAPGDRIAILSENRSEYLETYLAAAMTGAVLACQNWRLSPLELTHCLDLVDPALILVSERHAGTLAGIAGHAGRALSLGAEYETALAHAEPSALPALETATVVKVGIKAAKPRPRRPMGIQTPRRAFAPA